MKNKFAMPLTWHNCQFYPPSERYNNRLLATDGKCVFPVVYDAMDGWWDIESKYYLPFGLLQEYWWADIEQTVRNCLEFNLS
jgi:hypothetical protein